MMMMYVNWSVVAETGATAALGQMDVDISEAGEGWGDEDIIIDEGQSNGIFITFIVVDLIQ